MRRRNKTPQTFLPLSLSLSLSLSLPPSLSVYISRDDNGQNHRSSSTLHTSYTRQPTDNPSLTQVRWVDASDMGGCGITTGMKKVLALATKARSGGAGGGAPPPAAKWGGRGIKSGGGKPNNKRKGTAAEKIKEEEEGGGAGESSKYGPKRAKAKSSTTRGGR